MPGKRILTVVLIAMAMMLGSPTNQIKYMKLFPNETRLSQSTSDSFIGEQADLSASSSRSLVQLVVLLLEAIIYVMRNFHNRARRP